MFLKWRQEEDMQCMQVKCKLTAFILFLSRSACRLLFFIRTAAELKKSSSSVSFKMRKLEPRSMVGAAAYEICKC
jgi:hypothetical protein